MLTPQLCPHDLQLFYSYLDQAKHYLEFGSGGSTYQASLRPNLQSIHSVESDEMWYFKVRSLIEQDNFTYHFIDLACYPGYWGYPSEHSDLKDWTKYSDVVFELDRQGVASDLDLVLIDGRFRVVCCLKLFHVIKDDCVILFDDLCTRPHYHIVLTFYDEVERTQDNCMVVLRKKKNIEAPSAELIRWYELIQD